MAADPSSTGRVFAQLVAASLVPWAAFLIALVVADRWSDTSSINWTGFPGAPATTLVIYLGFIAVPSALPLVVAERGWMRIVALSVMTTVAAVAGVLVMTTDDAQAGLAVLWVPLTATVLTGVIIVWRIVGSIRHRGAGPPEWNGT